MQGKIRIRQCLQKYNEICDQLRLNSFFRLVADREPGKSRVIKGNATNLFFIV